MCDICDEIISNSGLDIPESLSSKMTDENFLYAILCLNSPYHNTYNNHDATNIIITMCRERTNWNIFDRLIDNNGGSLVHHLHFHSYEYCIQHMIDAGLNVNATDKDGNTALHTNRNAAIVDILLHNKADIYIKNDEGLTCDQMQKPKSIRKINRKHRQNIGLINVRGADHSSIRHFRKLFNKLFQKHYCDYCDTHGYISRSGGAHYCHEDFMSLYEMWKENHNRFYGDRDDDGYDYDYDYE